MMSGRSNRARPGWRTCVLAVGLSLLLAGCYTATARRHQEASPDTRPYWCNAVGEGTPPGGHGNGNHVHPFYQGMTKGPLSWEECDRLSNQLDAVHAAVQDMPTAADAEAAGWSNFAGYVTGLGTHHSTQLIPGTGPRPFDPAKPDFLIYGGPGPDAPLVGVGYAAPGSESPPEGFAGSNDWWHLHEHICFGGGQILAGAEEISDEECAALGGRNFRLPGSGLWLLHMWAEPGFQIRPDIFMSGHPCLGESGPLPRTDACWDIADHDPADGPYPGQDTGGEHDGGEHDAHGEQGH